MLENWEIVKQDKQNEFADIYYSEEVSNQEIQKMMKKITTSSASKAPPPRFSSR